MTGEYARLQGKLSARLARRARAWAWPGTTTPTAAMAACSLTRPWTKDTSSTASHHSCVSLLPLARGSSPSVRDGSSALIMARWTLCSSAAQTTGSPGRSCRSCTGSATPRLAIRRLYLTLLRSRSCCSSAERTARSSRRAAQTLASAGRSPRRSGGPSRQNGRGWPPARRRRFAWPAVGTCCLATATCGCLGHGQGPPASTRRRRSSRSCCSRTIAARPGGRARCSTAATSARSLGPQTDSRKG